MASSSGDYYHRLRLSRNASHREIKAAFRQLSRQYHPDLNPHQPGAAARFQALQEAYEVLIDRVQRQQYDRSQQGHGARLPANPQTPTDFYIRGVGHSFSRRYRAALRDYTQAIALDHQFAEAYLRRAEVRYWLEDDSGVLTDCQQSIALSPTDADAYYYQGLARYRLNYVQSAIAAFTEAIACDPEDARYYYRRGLAHQDLNDLNEAAKDLRRAARLYREQGDMTKYHHLQQYLRPFGTAGRSGPVRALGKAAQQLSRLTGRRSARHRPTDPIRRASTFLPPPAAWPLQLDERAQTGRPSSQPPPRQPPRPRTSKQTYWAPGVSSRPQLGQRPPKRPGLRLLLAFASVFKLLSNPAGEMLPTYWRLSSRQAALAGYGLAVIANLCFVAAGLVYLSADSWLVASRLWAAGGLMFVMMVLTVAIARVCLRIRGLWAADIFILGTAITPLGLIVAVTATIRQSPMWTGGLEGSWLAYALALIAVLWAFSHALITLYSGLSRIHTFPERTVAWFAPVVLALGIAAGIGTWHLLTVTL
ncbi:MAG: DnaJ domain-containing protein [Phormidesmis sp.]